MSKNKKKKFVQVSGHFLYILTSGIFDTIVQYINNKLKIIRRMQRLTDIWTNLVGGSSSNLDAA